MIHVLDSEDEPDRFSGICALRFVVVCIDKSSEEEEEKVSLNRKRGLRKLLADRAKRSAPKDTSRSQPPLPLPPPPSLTVNPFAPANLKKRKNEKEVAEDGELVPQKDEVPSKQQNMAKGKGWASSVERPERGRGAPLEPRMGPSVVTR